MIENIEDFSSSFSDSAKLEKISQLELEFIGECVSPPMSEDLAIRIDDILGETPPKAIDSNPEIAEMIEPIRDQIPSTYLEAPADSIQIPEAVEAMENIEGLDFSEWKEASFEDRVAALQKLEIEVAEIAHRPGCQLNVQDLGEGYYGYFDPNTKEITVNSFYIESNNFADYKECLDTIVHEGRHAYQDYNMTCREVHPRGAEVDNWRLNSDSDLGYLDAQIWGFELYEYQPMESDARAFAGDVLNQYLKNA